MSYPSCTYFVKLVKATHKFPWVLEIRNTFKHYRISIDNNNTTDNESILRTNLYFSERWVQEGSSDCTFHLVCMTHISRSCAWVSLYLGHIYSVKIRSFGIRARHICSFILATVEPGEYVAGYECHLAVVMHNSRRRSWNWDLRLCSGSCWNPVKCIIRLTLILLFLLFWLHGPFSLALTPFIVFNTANYKI
jgi:hypothetical protein